MASSRHPFPRQLLSRVRHDLRVYPAVAIMGARQVGKTTLARELGRELGFAYCSLDERGVREQAIEDPEGLIQSVSSTGAVFDEVQRAPDLLLALKVLIDREQQVGRFLLTGSNQPRVSNYIAESLVGRVAYRTLRPLTLGEQRYDDSHRRWSWFFELSEKKLQEKLHESAALSDRLDWRTVVATGGMPRALAQVPFPDRLQVLEDYLRTFAQRDVREVLEVDSVERLERFLRLAAARTGSELNFASLAKDLGQSVNTIRRWIGALERSYLVDLVPAFSRNASSRVIKAPKIFMVDSALALAGSGERQPTGWHFETLVANDLLVWRDEAPGRTLAHWRLPAGPEVDFVLGREDRLVAVEVKGTESVGREDARHLCTFLERHPEALLGVLLSGDGEIRMIRERVIAAPWWSVL